MARKNNRSKFEFERVAPAIRPKNNNQAAYLDALRTSSQVISLGPAGTGKTWLAATYAADRLRDHKISRIIITRPNVPCGRSLGFFPGTITEKFSVWCLPVLEAIKERLGTGAFECAVKNGSIELVPFETIRGMTFKHAIVILDEAENCTVDEIKVFVTRVGEDCQLIINGDVSQTDIKESSGLAKIVHLVKSLGLPVPIIEFEIDDVVRSGACAMWLKAFAT